MALGTAVLVGSALAVTVGVSGKMVAIWSGIVGVPVGITNTGVLVGLGVCVGTGVRVGTGVLLGRGVFVAGGASISAGACVARDDPQATTARARMIRTATRRLDIGALLVQR